MTETASYKRKIVIEPVTRVEGHGKVTVRLGDDNRVIETRLHIVEFRGFERFVQGRPYWEAPVLVQRLCGICPVSHHLCAAKAMDVIVGARRIPLTAEKIRRLMHAGQVFQSHVLHFFHLASPDLLFGIDSNPETRNIVGLIQSFPELAKKAILMRKFGQEVIEVTSGKKIHGTGAIAGGMNAAPNAGRVRELLRSTTQPNVDQMIAWSLEGLDLFKEYLEKNRSFADQFADYPSNYLSLVGKGGAMDLYHGTLRATDSEGRKIFDKADYQNYRDLIAEEVRQWTYMKFPFLKSLGREEGWYRVGPLARMNNVDFIPTPLAQKALEEFRRSNGGKPCGKILYTHWARLIEVLHCAEVMRDLLCDPELLEGKLETTGRRVSEGVGVLEAPRGTLFHHYRVGGDDLITMCNLIVSTTNNNEALNRSVNIVARKHIDGKATITEAALNHIEVAIRAFDPCLSCATHAVGKMPLEVLLVNERDEILERRSKSGRNA